MLFHRLTDFINQTDHILHTRDCLRGMNVNEYGKDLSQTFGQTVQNLVDFSHRYEFSLEDAVTANVQDNRTEENFK